MEDKGYTKGAPYLLTATVDEGSFSRSLYFLLPDGTRKKVTIPVSEDNPEMRAKLGLALATGELRGRKWKRNRNG